jgi:hypothetical protein
MLVFKQQVVHMYVFDILTMLMQYDLLLGTIFTNIHAITLLLYIVIHILCLKHFLYKYCAFYYIQVEY